MKKIIIITTLIFFLGCTSAMAADYRFTYKKGKISVTGNAIKSGKDSMFAISFGAASEVRCGPGSTIEINSVTKTGESVFTLKSGSCFIRIIDDSGGAGVALKAPFVVLKSRSAAFYADCGAKEACVYGGSARIEFKKGMAKLTQGRTYKDGKIIENKPFEDRFRQWAIKRDKNDITVNFMADGKKEEILKKILTDALAKEYSAGNAVLSDVAGPEDTFASVKITSGKDGPAASGAVSSGISGNLGVIDVKKETGKPGSMTEEQAFFPLMYETAAAISAAIEQADAVSMKTGRKTIIEAEGLPDKDIAAIEKAVRKMTGFISLEQKKYHNTKVIFEVLQAGTGYDISEVLGTKFEKSNISIWKISKNIVKLRVVKVES